MERRYRVRTRTDGPAGLLALVRRSWEHGSSAMGQSAMLTTTDLGALRAIGSLLGQETVEITLETGSPGALVRGLPSHPRLGLRQAEALGVPETTVSCDRVHWRWNQLDKMRSRPVEELSAARDRMTGQLIDRLTVCQAAGLLELASSPEAWVRELLAMCDASGPGARWRTHGSARCILAPGPPAIPWDIELPVTADAPATLAGSPIWHDREPVQIDTRLSGTDAATLALPDGSLRTVNLGGDPGPALDALYAAACDRPETRFWLGWESARWVGQDNYFTYGSSAELHKWDDGPPVLDLTTNLRYPVATTVTPDIAEEWCREADAVLARLAEALGVEIDPPVLVW